MPLVDPRFLSMIVHDLRTPLNVMGLTVRVITQTNPNRSAELDEDLTILLDHVRQSEKMLAQLSEYCRLIEGGANLDLVEFDPRRFLADLVDDYQVKATPTTPPIRLEIAEAGPTVVALDPARARLAIAQAVANAAATASADHPIRLGSSGQPGRWVVQVAVDRVPPPTVTPTELQPGAFERLSGSAAERRGLDLAIAAQISGLFGGSARLDVEPGRGTTIVLDWPDRIAPG